MNAAGRLSARPVPVGAWSPRRSPARDSPAGCPSRRRRPRCLTPRPPRSVCGCRAGRGVVVRRCRSAAGRGRMWRVRWDRRRASPGVRRGRRLVGNRACCRPLLVNAVEASWRTYHDPGEPAAASADQPAQTHPAGRHQLRLQRREQPPPAPHDALASSWPTSVSTITPPALSRPSAPP